VSGIDGCSFLRGQIAAARYFGGGCPYIICYCIGGCQVGGGGAGDFGAGGLAGGLGAGGLFDFEVGDGGVIGDLGDHGTGVGKLDAADVADGGVEGAEDEFGAFEFDRAAQQGVDDLDEGGLDGFLVLEEGSVVDAGRGRALDGAEHALVEVAELLSAESGGAATDSVTLMWVQFFGFGILVLLVLLRFVGSRLCPAPCRMVFC